MQANEAARYMSRQFKDRRGVELPETALKELQNILIRGRETALNEKNEEAFDTAVQELSRNLLAQVKTQRAMTAGGGEVVVASEASLRNALRKICPMWPFC